MNLFIISRQSYQKHFEFFADIHILGLDLKKILF
jgi:hypothetical protein